MRTVAAARTAARAGPWLAAALAAAAALPAIPLPPLSDDWVLFAAARNGNLAVVPMGYVRPVTLASFRVSWELAGAEAWPLHLLSVALAALCAGLAVKVFRAWTGRPVLSTVAGLLFALHPFHVDAVAWSSALGDLWAAAGLLVTALAYERWLRSGGPAAWTLTVSSYLFAMASKEVAVAIPLALLARQVIDRRHDLRRGAGVLVPIFLLGAAYLLGIRPAILESSGNAIPWPSAERAVVHAGYYAGSLLFPLPPEMLEAAPWAAGLGTVVAVVAMVFSSRRGRFPGWRVSAGALAAAGVLTVPALLSFQSRHFVLATVPASLALAAAARSLRPPRSCVAPVALGIVWVACAAFHWHGWHDAGTASRSLLEGLAREAHDPGVTEIVLADAPHRVRGMPVFGDFTAALSLTGRREIPVRAAARIDLPSPEADFVVAVAKPDDSHPMATVDLAVERALHSRLAVPVLPPGGSVDRGETGTAADRGGGRVRLEIPVREGRAILLWRGGRIIRL